MKQYRILAVLMLVVLALVAAPCLDGGVALAKESQRNHQTALKEKSAQKKVVKRRKSVAPAKAESGKSRSKRRRSSRHVRHVPAPVDNEEGLSSCPVVPHLRVKSAILYDVNTGEVLYEQNPDFRIAPASLTKIITLYLIFDAIRQGRLRPWDIVQVSERAATQGGSNMHLRRGESVKVTELIKGIAVASANDACMAMAEYLEDNNVDAFVALMNATAKRLGMSNTTFENPNGLPADAQLTTARDMLKLAVAYLGQFPKALSIHSMQYFTHNKRQRHNANSLLAHYAGCDGLKTGFVCSSGYNIIATAKRGGTRLIAVVLGSHNPVVRQVETEKLLNKGFRLAETKHTAVPAAASATPPNPPASVVAGPAPVAGQQPRP